MNRTKKGIFSRTSTRRTGANATTPKWLQKCELSFLRTGKLNLSSVEKPDLSQIKSRSSMKELNIAKCQIETIEGLAFQPNLSVFNADNSQLSSFKNFASISKASIFGLKNTPLSKKPHYLIAIVIMSDAEKPIVDGKLISERVKAKASQYPPYTRDLINLGWEITYPCPSSDEMRDLCREYNVTYIEDEQEEEVPAETEAVTLEAMEEDLEEDEERGYLEWIDRLMDKHNQIINDAARQFELLDESVERFQFEVRDILEKRMHYMFDESGDMDLQILTAVRSLCLHRQRRQM